MWDKSLRGIRTTAVTGVLSCSLSGCFLHKKVQPQPIILARQTTVALETPPAVASPPLLDAPHNQAKLPPVPVAEAATKPKRVRRKPKQPATLPAAQAPVTAAAGGGAAAGSAPSQPSSAGQGTPVQVASNTPPPTPAPAGAVDTVLGSLTPGGVDQSPQARQETQELLASTDRRLNALPGQTQQTQRAQISQIRNFWKQGVDALKAGDAEGAKTLALKAKLLLDDLEKAAQ